MRLNRSVWSTAEPPAWQSPLFLPLLLEGPVSLSIFWSGRSSNSWEQKQCAKSWWRQIMRELASITGVIWYRLSSNWFLPSSWGKSWSIVNTKGERTSPQRAALLEPKWNSVCFSLADPSQHYGRRVRITGNSNLTFPYFTAMHKSPKCGGRGRFLTSPEEMCGNCWTIVEHGNCGIRFSKY